MKANIQISFWVPLIFILVSTVFFFVEFNALDVIMLVGVIIIVGYYAVGFFKRKDALLIEGSTMIVTSPISSTEFDLQELTSVALEDNGTILRGVYHGQKIKLVTSIYDVSLEEVKHYLISHYDHITEEKK